MLIVQGKLRAKINQQDGTVEVQFDADAQRLKVMKDWTRTMGNLWAGVLNETGPDAAGPTSLSQASGFLSDAAMLSSFSNGAAGSRSRAGAGAGGGFGKAPKKGGLK
ncbi:MAG: hypothetical protein INR71_13920 [Terriglobus roseus]|nr:hypothetical protein [Terriglobus roseus]